MLLGTSDQIADHRLPNQPGTAQGYVGMSHSVREPVVHQRVHGHLDGHGQCGIVRRDASVPRRTWEQPGPTRSSPRHIRRLVAIYYSSRIITAGTGLLPSLGNSSLGSPWLNASNREGLSPKCLSGRGEVPGGECGVCHVEKAQSSQGDRRRAQDRTAA